MNVTLKKRNNKEIDAERIEDIAKGLGLDRTLVEILYLRGIDTAESVAKFLTPNIDHMYDPFLLKGMEQAAERIKSAIEGSERIVIYGDYDADGICAAAILSLYLQSRGISVYTHIPNRIGEGYGLNVKTLEKIIESVCPDLIITCDCGISAYEEAEFVMDLGVDIIITDHHEPAEKIPQCTVINPKQPDCKYPYNYLCGAGVALKVVEALGGRKVMEEYLDLACIATIADLVPLLDENRLIVQLGLKKINLKKNVGLRVLLANQNLNGEILSADIAFKIAPRINAAGRMGDAYRAFELLTSDKPEVINSIMEEINDANTLRKDVCDSLYSEAVAALASEDMVNSRAIVLSHPSWEKGITGIVAARLTNDFKRPSFIMVRSDDAYKGTCRSIEDINIYEALNFAADLLNEYGGHSQAAGFSIREENIPAFKERINLYLSRFDDDLFLPSVTYDVEINLRDIRMPLIKELNKLEPTGNSFTKPLFKVCGSDLSVSVLKNNVNHTVVTTENGFQIFAFNYCKQAHYLMGHDKKEMVLELQANSYNGKEYARGILKGVSCENLYTDDETAKAIYIKHLNIRTDPSVAVYSQYAEKELPALVGENLYGTLIFAFDRDSYAALKNKCALKNVVHEDYIYSSSLNNYTRIMVAPDFDSNLLLFNYKKIILLDKPLSDSFISYLNKKTDAEIFVPKEDNRQRFIENLDVTRAQLGKYYEYIRKYPECGGSNIYSYFKNLRKLVPDINMPQFMFCINIFLELELISVSKQKFGFVFSNGEKRDLTDSAILGKVIALKKDYESTTGKI